jgi:hypothetical protein
LPKELTENESFLCKNCDDKLLREVIEGNRGKGNF